MKGLRFYEKLIVIANTLSALLLLLSYGLSFLPPKQFGYLSVLSLGVPVLIILNLLFVLYWLLKLKKQVFISLIVLLLGFNYLTSMYQVSGDTSSISPNSFTVMSYNVRLFNLFNWIEDDAIGSKIATLINTVQPDIISIQEYHLNKDFIIEGYFKYESLSGDRVKSGQAIFSKFPIINSGAIQFPNTSNDAIFIDVVIASDTLRVYNLHLQSSKIIPSVNGFKNESSENLMNRISKTFQTQQSQAEQFLKHSADSPYTNIITGDFNNTPYSYVYDKIKGDYQDAFDVAGDGFGRTYDFKLFPFRIDFILVDEFMEVNDFETFRSKFSDHYPIMATLKIHQ